MTKPEFSDLNSNSPQDDFVSEDSLENQRSSTGNVEGQHSASDSSKTREPELFPMNHPTQDRAPSENPGLESMGGESFRTQKLGSDRKRAEPPIGPQLNSARAVRQDHKMAKHESDSFDTNDEVATDLASEQPTSIYQNHAFDTALEPGKETEAPPDTSEAASEPQSKETVTSPIGSLPSNESSRELKESTAPAETKNTTEETAQKKLRKKRRKPLIQMPPVFKGVRQTVRSSSFLRKLIQFRGWPWFLVIGVSGATSVSAFAWLSDLPPVPNCKQISTTWTDAGRLYCADQAARKQDPKALASALEMVSDWDQEDPMFEQVSKLSDDWSRSILEVARKTLEEGKLKDAVALAEKVPQSSSYHDQAQARIKEWQGNWKEGEELLEKARDAIQEQDWGMATEHMRRLVQLGGEQWQQRADKLISEMTIEQEAFRKLNLADDRANYGTIEDIQSAIELATKIDPNRLARKKLNRYVDKWSEKLIELADYYHEIGDYKSAIKAARAVPPGSKSGDDAQAYLQISRAKKVTQDDSLLGYFQAIAFVSQVPENKEILEQSEDQTSEWEAQVQSWSQVQFAKLFSRFDQGTGYDIAIQHASMVDPESPRRIEAQSLIAQWDKQRNSVIDRRSIARATLLAKSDELEKVQAAIAEAQKVKSDSPFRTRAQSLISEWSASIERREDQPILDKAIALAKQGNLNAAIETADQIGSDRALYDDAQDEIAKWVAEIQIAQDRPILDDAEALARNGQLSAAINRASEIGYGRALYYDAQDRIGAWAAELDRIAAANRSYQRQQEYQQEQQYYEEEQPYYPPEPEPEPYAEPAPRQEEYVDSASGAGTSGSPDF